jgi:GNAT superfamily N-acetyltransferase
MFEYDFVPVGERATPEDYTRLFARAYGANDKLTIRYLKWLYQENPHGAAVGIDAFLGDDLVAHYATIPRRYIVGGMEVPLLLSVNTATDPDHQKRGLFKKLAFATYERGADLGYQYVIGVANAQSIHAFETSLGFERLGQIRLAIGRHPPRLSIAAPRLAADTAWLRWRLSNPSAKYFLTNAGQDEVVINTRRGRATVSIGRASTVSVEGIANLPRNSSRGILPMSPVFPVRNRGPFLPARLMQSPWHVILRSLQASSIAVMHEVQFDGLSMDTF